MIACVTPIKMFATSLIGQLVSSENPLNTDDTHVLGVEIQLF
jgi:hypothetical protein